MVRRSTVLDLPDTPRWDPEANKQYRTDRETGERKLVPVKNPYTKAQKDRAVKIGKRISKRVEDHIEKVEQQLPDDPEKAVYELDEEAQFAAVLYQELLDARDDAIADLVASVEGREEAGDLMGRLSDKLFLSESRLRQIRVKDRIESDEPSHAEEVAARLNRDYLKKEYVENKKTIKQIAEEAGVDAGAVSRHLHKHGFPVRTATDEAYLEQRRKRRQEAQRQKAS